MSSNRSRSQPLYDEGGSNTTVITSKGGLPLWAWVIISLVGVVILKRLFTGGFSFTKDASITAADETSLNNILNTPGAIPKLLANDTSPVTLTVHQGQYTDQEVVALAAKLGQDYAAEGLKVAEALNLRAEQVFQGVILFLGASPAEGVVRAAGMKLYFDTLAVWGPRYDAVTKAVAVGVADIAKANFEQINLATECTTTTFVKKVDETAQSTDTAVYTVNIRNGSSGGFLGMNKSKSSEETRSSVRTLVTNETRQISYIPHCTNWQLDITRFAALLASQSLAVSYEYGLLANVLAMAPKPSDFIVSAPKSGN